MEILSVYDSVFAPYGKVLTGYDGGELAAAMEKIPMPERGTAYRASIAALEYSPVFGKLQNNAYGGMPIQLGMCWGYNDRLNCLEYHRDSEINMGTGDFILLLAKQEQIVQGKLDTALVKAFRVPSNVFVEIYATTLHYAPCHTDPAAGFRMAVVLPKGTNTAMPEITPLNEEDKWMLACNKWLLAHPDSDEAAVGAYVGLTGENLCIR